MILYYIFNFLEAIIKYKKMSDAYFLLDIIFEVYLLNLKAVIINFFLYNDIDLNYYDHIIQNVKLFEKQNLKNTKCSIFSEKSNIFSIDINYY